MKQDTLLLAFSLLDGIGKGTSIKIAKYISAHTSNRSGFEQFLHDMYREGVLSAKQFEAAGRNSLKPQLDEAISLIEDSAKAGVELVSYLSPDYPRQLKKLSDPPLFLSLRGNRSLLGNEDNIAVVGTRENSPYAEKAGRRLVEIFVRRGYAITSGLALGCDTIAHDACLQANGQTMAILAHGLDSVYPKTNAKLAERILANGGLLVSEYFVGTKPTRFSFVERDRLQCGLASAVVFLETGVKGGTIHAIEGALKYKKVLACLYSHPAEAREGAKFQGNLKYVSEHKAMPLESPDSIERFFNRLSSSHQTQPTKQTSFF